MTKLQKEQQGKNRTRKIKKFNKKIAKQNKKRREAEAVKTEMRTILQAAPAYVRTRLQLKL